MKPRATRRSPPLVFLHGIGGAARAWRGQLDFFQRQLSRHRLGHAGLWRIGAACRASASPALPTRLQDFLQQVGATKPVIVGHSIGGMIVQQLLAKSPHIASAVVLAQTSPAFGKPDGDWQKNFIDARLGPLDRGETLATLAPSLVKELVGDDPDAAGMELARDCMAAVPEATYRATMLALMGFDLRHALKNIAVPTLVLSGSKDNNAPAPMMAKMASYIPAATYVELEGVGHLANLERPDDFNAALDRFSDGRAMNATGADVMMTAPTGKIATTAGGIKLDAPIFDPQAFRLNDEQAAIIATARELGQTVFAGRAAAYDREARFPTENYKDLHRAGLLGIAIPKKHGGLGADYQTYAIAAAEIGRYCGATALTWNMHVCSTLWSGPLADDLDMDAATRAEHERRRAVHYKRIVERRRDLFAAVLGRRRGRGRRRRVRHRSKTGQRRLDRQRQEDLCLAVRPCRLLRRALHRDRGRRKSLAPQHAVSGAARQGRRRLRGRRLGSAGHARHGLAHAAVQGRVRAGGCGADAARGLFPGRDALAAYVPDAVADLCRPGAGGL